MPEVKVLIIDGPARGEVYETRNTRFQAVAQIPLSETAPDDDDLGIRQVVYHTHKFYIAGRMIRLASVSSQTDGISDADVFDLLISDKAKEAAI